MGGVDRDIPSAESSVESKNSEPIEKDEKSEEQKLQKAFDSIEARLANKEDEHQASIGKIEYKPVKTASSVHYVVDNEVVVSRDRKIHEGLVKARAAKNFNGEPIFDDGGPGGYAISEKLQRINSRRSNLEHKMKVQRYLLEQIKDGWPYDEKFYRPEGFFTLILSFEGEIKIRFRYRHHTQRNSSFSDCTLSELIQFPCFFCNIKC